MNIYFIIFIIVIPITIFLTIVFSDSEFKKRLSDLKNEINPLKFDERTQQKQLNFASRDLNKKYYLNDGIGFGFGKEFFTCKQSSAQLTSKQREKLKKTSIGIKIHKFKMNKSYNIPEIDNVVLKDYCSDDYLEKNFINILNNIWYETGVNYFLTDIIHEDEIDNLTKYYLYDPKDDIIYPKCEEIVNFKRNPIKYVGNIPTPPTRLSTAATSTEPVITSPAYDAGNINNLFVENTIPELNQVINPQRIPIPDHINRVKDKEIKKMAELDIYLLKRILGQQNTLNEQERKNTIRNIFFRMTDETQYLNDKNLHIYLVPYIEDDFAFILEGRNNRPLLVMSMYHKDCNKMEKVLEMVSSSKTCGDWVTKLKSNYIQLRNTEEEYNRLANIDIVENSNNICGPGIIESSPKVNKEIINLRETESKIFDKINNFKNENKHINTSTKKLNLIINEMDKLLNYDYENDHEVKKLKNYKNRRVSRIVIINGEKKEISLGYSELLKEKLDELKEVNKSKIQSLNKEKNIEQSKIDSYNDDFDKLNIELNKAQEQITSKLNPKKFNVATLKNLKERLDRISKDISVPMFYADDLRNVLNINTIILMLFGITSPKITLENKIKDINKEVKICNILLMDIIDGGISKSINKIHDQIINNKSYNFFLNFDKLSISNEMSNVIFGPEFNKNGLYTNGDSNKCSILGAGNVTLESAIIPNAKMFCEDSKFYETGKLHALDINAQYYLMNQLISKIENGEITNINSNDIESLEKFKKKLEFECTGCKYNDNSNYRAEPGFIKSQDNIKFFSAEEAIKNYEWLAKFIVKNRLEINDDFIFEGADYLQKNSNIFTEELVNKYFSKNPEVTDAIPCSVLDKDSDLFNVDTTLLNEYILKKSNCNNNYMNSFKESYI
jgi:hypothetical protein